MRKAPFGWWADVSSTDESKAVNLLKRALPDVQQFISEKLELGDPVVANGASPV